MKKRLIILFCTVFLIACKTSSNITMMVPQGSPAMTILGLNDDVYNIDIVNGPDVLIAAFGSGSHDAIIAPTNLGAKLYGAKDNYRLAASLVWGNYHLVSQSFDEPSFLDLDQKEIIVFGRNQTSDIILQFLINAHHINPVLTYVDSLQNAQAMYILEPHKIVMVAEPSLSTIKTLVQGTKSIDLQHVYQDITQASSYPQASLFVHKRLSNRDVETLCQDIKTSIEGINRYETSLIQKGVSLGIATHESVLRDAIEGSHLSFAYGLDVVLDIEAYFEIIIAMNPKLLGNTLPPRTFYWSKP